MRALRHPRRDRPKPFAIFRRSVGLQDAVEVLGAVESVVVVIRPLVARAALGCAFWQEHGSA